MVVPYNAILTISLDCKVRCFKKEILVWIYIYHCPLKQLDYTKSNGGAILFCGYSANFTVWDIENCESFAKD